MHCSSEHIALLIVAGGRVASSPLISSRQIRPRSSAGTSARHEWRPQPLRAFKVYTSHYYSRSMCPPPELGTQLNSHGCTMSIRITFCITHWLPPTMLGRLTARHDAKSRVRLLVRVPLPVEHSLAFPHAARLIGNRAV